MLWMMLALSAALGVTGSENTANRAGQTLQTLSCPPCERIHCTPGRALRLQCKGGVTTGICGCCPVCARTEGETCGGTWDYLGKCDEGLLCVYQGSTDGQAEEERKGVCRAVLEPLDSEGCRPECTKEYCQANPTEICSARSVAVEKQVCHGSCQHTSCSACLLLRPPSCHQACGTSDASCLHHFGRCMHNHLSTPHSPVCNPNLQHNAAGYFMCLLPACPNSLP